MDKANASKYQWILDDARKDFEAGMNHLDFHNKYLGVGNKYVPKDEKERAEFMETGIVREIQKMVAALQEKQPEINLPDEVDSYSGNFIVRVPKSLHMRLVKEAEAEGVSLNYLVTVKLAVSLKDYLHKKVNS
jgi:predicted HicB family RNase H-like nuclease